ncbi:helix-turn-helix transcriptional regulator [Massilia sp. METH4]|uniref:helix-turn-helix transcriptional regulator n=1 Tax=Massilia sp. METH4 TaxID=3123041 RepID=UPI0030CC9333
MTDQAKMFAGLGRLIAAVGRQDFAEAAFDLSQEAVGADHLVVSLVGGNEVRGLLTQGRLAPRVADTLNQRYLERYHLLDNSLPSLWNIASEQAAVYPFDGRMDASPAYKTFFFERAGLCDKLSIVCRRGENLLCCNLYRMSGSGRFDESDLRQAYLLAQPLAAVTWLHADKVVVPQAPTELVRTNAAPGCGAALQSLSKREMEVCRRLLTGASNEGVALDLAISIHTVRTLRKRIYRKLEVGSVTDLFSKYRNLIPANGAGVA